MSPHLEAFVVAKILLCVAVDPTGITRLEVCDLKRQRLFVELGNLRLSRIHYACHTGRKNVVDRFSVGILFDIHHRHIEVSFSRCVSTGVEVEIVGAPFASHQFEGGETQVGDLLEPGHEYPGEADG